MLLYLCPSPACFSWNQPVCGDGVDGQDYRRGPSASAESGCSSSACSTGKAQFIRLEGWCWVVFCLKLSDFSFTPANLFVGGDLWILHSCTHAHNCQPLHWNRNRSVNSPTPPKARHCLPSKKPLALLFSLLKSKEGEGGLLLVPWLCHQALAGFIMFFFFLSDSSRSRAVRQALAVPPTRPLGSSYSSAPWQQGASRALVATPETRSSAHAVTPAIRGI